MENFRNLEFLGWNSYFQSQLTEAEIKDFVIARVSIEFKNQYRIMSYTGELQAEPSGNLIYSSESASALPKVGDWVLATPFDDNKAIIQRVLQRKTQLSRKTAGSNVEEQVIASNLDVLFIVQALDQNFNINRIERYVSIVPNGINAVVILNKSDQCSETESKTLEVKKRLPHIPVLAISALYGDISELLDLIQIGKTAGFVGSSGTGKSTIVNRLCGRLIQQTKEIRGSDGKGRHTTTARQLILMENGAILMDTPGMRELQLWEAGDSIDSAFPEIEKLAELCRFRDCSHTVENGCAVLEAVEEEQLSYDQYRNYLKLRKEEQYLLSLRNDHVYMKRKKFTKKMQRLLNQMKRG